MIYLDNAATSFPKPGEVTREVYRCMSEYCGNPGRGSHRMALAASNALYSARTGLCELFGASEPERCVFTLNTTYALNIALKSVVTRGCHILISDLEHNSVYRQVVKLRDDGISSFDMLGTFGGDAGLIISDIQKKIRNSTTVLICQISSNICGVSMPVKTIGELCRKNGITFIADAAQSAGVYDIDVESMHIDALCLPSHKGLYGPQGAGVILFSERMSEKSVAMLEGGSGSNSLSERMPDELPDRFEAGTMPTPAIAGLAKGVAFIKSIGFGAVREHEKELSNLLVSGLRNDDRFTVYDSSHTGGIVLFNVKGRSPVEVSSLLDSYGICVRSGFHCAPLAHRTLGTGDSGAVRVSFGVFNKRSDVEKLLNILMLI